MPDRFDLMDHDDVLAALRISSQYCARAIGERITEPERLHLDRGRQWLTNIHDQLKHWPDEVDERVFETAPTFTQPSETGREALDQFAAVNDSLRDLFASGLQSHWKKSVPYLGGTSAMFADLARHAARISQTTSVDRTWVW